MDVELWEYYGRCTICNKLLTFESWSEHGCVGFSVDRSYNAKLNPENLAWMPGYRFKTTQEALTKRGLRQRIRRKYRVFWIIDQNGNLKWAGGVQPRPETFRSVENLYKHNRFGPSQRHTP